MILVTGHAGLFGRALTTRLRGESREFAILERGGHGGGDLRVREVATAALHSHTPDTVVHLAGGRGHSRAELFERNVLTTSNVIKAAADSQPIPGVIVMGSAAEYGAGRGEPFHEDDPLQPVSDYGLAKVAQTALAISLGERLSVPVTVLRPFNPVSAELGREVALGNARAQLLEGRGPNRRLRLGRLDVVRDFVPVEFIVDAIIAVIDRRHENDVINVCSGVGIKLGDVVAAMAAVLGVSFVVDLEEDLAALPAADIVIGDPTRLEEKLGLRSHPTPESLAEILTGG
jgi:nucleoside-diphosphate-sugar epimerase